MDIRSMRYFLEVAKTKSFTNAAHRLYLSPQALGKAIREMEAEMGQPLFVRDRRALQLTAFGRSALREAEQCVSQFDRSLARISSLAREAAGCVNIVCAYGIPNALGYESPAVLRRRLRERTGLEVDIAFDELPDLLAERELYEESCDLGLLMGAPEPAALYETALLRVHRLVAVVAPGHPLAGRESLTVRELAGYAVASKNRYYHTYHVLESCARRQQVTLTYALCSPDDTLWRQKVREGAVGIGVSFLSESALQGGFVVTPFEEEDMVYPIYLARRKDHDMSDALRALWRTIAEDGADNRG